MKKHLVLGCYRFVGYHLCDFLLERGEEVIGVDWTTNLVDDECEEKALSFGRNANFTFQSLMDGVFDLKGDCVIHIPYYDFDISQFEILEKIKEITGESHQEDCVVIELYPYGAQFEDEKGKIKVVSPTIYGPWQPKGELIRCLLSDEAVSSNNEIALIDDAIFVRDLVEEWPKLLELQTGVYELVTDLHHHLTSCLEYANDKVEVPLLTSRKINHKKYEIHIKTQPEVGIKKQKKHMDIQKKLQEWKRK